MERRRRNRNVISVLKTLRICVLKRRSQGNRCLAANLLGLVGALQNGDQRVSQFVVDDREVARELCSKQQFVLGCSVITKNVEQLLPSPFRPVPRWSVFQGARSRRAATAPAPTRPRRAART